MGCQRKKQSFPPSPAVVSNDVEFAIRGPLPATWGSDEDHRSRPGSCILDLLFSSPTKVGELVFRNYYTAWITVLVRIAPPAGGASNNTSTTGNKATTSISRNNTSRSDLEGTLGSWKLSIPRRVLMPFPHQETGSHDVISIAATESLVEWNNLQAMRLLLQQPSPVWRTFHVEEISVMRDVPRRLHRLHLASTPSATTAVTTPSCNVLTSMESQHIGLGTEPVVAATNAIPEVVGAESRLVILREQTLVALRKSNAPEREGPPPKDFVGLVGYEVQGLLTI